MPYEGSRGKQCVVVGCTNSQRDIYLWKVSVCEIHGEKHEDCICVAPFKFHCIPKNDDVRRDWLREINRKDYRPSGRALVCSRHFVDGRPTMENPIPTLHMGLPSVKNTPARGCRKKKEEDKSSSTETSRQSVLNRSTEIGRRIKVQHKKGEVQRFEFERNSKDVKTETDMYANIHSDHTIGSGENCNVLPQLKYVKTETGGMQCIKCFKVFLKANEFNEHFHDCLSHKSTYAMKHSTIAMKLEHNEKYDNKDEKTTETVKNVVKKEVMDEDFASWKEDTTHAVNDIGIKVEEKFDFQSSSDNCCLDPSLTDSCSGDEVYISDTGSCTVEEFKISDNFNMEKNYENSGSVNEGDSDVAGTTQIHIDNDNIMAEVNNVTHNNDMDCRGVRTGTLMLHDYEMHEDAIGKAVTGGHASYVQPLVEIDELEEVTNEVTSGEKSIDLSNVVDFSKKITITGLFCNKVAFESGQLNNKNIDIDCRKSGSVTGHANLQCVLGNRSPELANAVTENQTRRSPIIPKSTSYQLDQLQTPSCLDAYDYTCIIKVLQSFPPKTPVYDCFFGNCKRIFHGDRVIQFKQHLQVELVNAFLPTNKYANGMSLVRMQNSLMERNVSWPIFTCDQLECEFMCFTPGEMSTHITSTHVCTEDGCWKRFKTRKDLLSHKKCLHSLCPEQCCCVWE